MAIAFPFSAIVGQDEMKLAILVAAVDPGIGGLLVFGDRGTGKSTAVRALAAQKWRRKSEQRDKWKLRASSRAEEGLARRSFDGQEVSAPHAAYPQSCVQGTGRPGRRA